MRSISLALALLCTSCDKAAVAPARLVPGDNLPASRVLTRETILIEQGFGGDGYGVHRLRYQLTPDDQLAIEYGLITQLRPVVKNNFRLQSNEADRIRKMLWRLRPQAMTSDWMAEWAIRPIGCEIQGPHDQGDVVVAYISGDNGEEGAAFELPTVHSCDTPAAMQARQVLQQLFSSFPESPIVTEFHKAEVNDELAPDWPNSKPIPSLERLNRSGEAR